MARFFETWELRNICIEYDWFTGGSCESYDKLFELCENGAEIEKLALVIWVCTPDTERDFIDLTLRKEYLKAEIRKALAELDDCVNIRECTNKIVELSRVLDAVMDNLLGVMSRDFRDFEDE